MCARRNHPERAARPRNPRASNARNKTPPLEATVTPPREQSTGLQEINTAINTIDQGTQQNAAMVEEQTAASHGLASEAAALNELRAAIPVLPTNIAHSNDQHDAVVRAILDGDDARAREAMEEHCDATAALLRGLIG